MFFTECFLPNVVLFAVLVAIQLFGRVLSRASRSFTTFFTTFLDDTGLGLKTDFIEKSVSPALLFKRTAILNDRKELRTGRVAHVRSFTRVSATVYTTSVHVCFFVVQLVCVFGVLTTGEKGIVHD
jgi:hypothetical protein